MFKYPLLKRKMEALRASIIEKCGDIPEEELDKQVRLMLTQTGLLIEDEESKDEDEARRSRLIVEDYT